VSVIIEATCHVLSSDKHHIIEQFTQHLWQKFNFAFIQNVKQGNQKLNIILGENCTNIMGSKNKVT